MARKRIGAGARGRAMVAALACGGLAACEQPKLPGDVVGTYEIEGTLVENSCGHTALPAADPLEFRVELRSNNGLGIWIMGSPPGVTGHLGSDGDFRFSHASRYTAIEPGARPPAPEEPLDFLRPDPPPATQVGCGLEILEQIVGVAHVRSYPPDASQLPDAGAHEDHLQADNSIEIVPTVGSDCRTALAASGGPFLELPCRARYELTGVLVDR